MLTWADSNTVPLLTKLKRFCEHISRLSITSRHDSLIIPVLTHIWHFISFMICVSPPRPYKLPFLNPLVVFSAFKGFFLYPDSAAPPCVFPLQLASSSSLSSSSSTMPLLSLAASCAHISILFSPSRSKQGCCGCLLLWFEPTGVRHPSMAQCFIHQCVITQTDTHTHNLTHTLSAKSLPICVSHLHANPPPPLSRSLFCVVVSGAAALRAAPECSRRWQISLEL